MTYEVKQGQVYADKHHRNYTGTPRKFRVVDVDNIGNRAYVQSFTETKTVINGTEVTQTHDGKCSFIKLARFKTKNYTPVEVATPALTAATPNMQEVNK